MPHRESARGDSTYNSWLTGTSVPPTSWPSTSCGDISQMCLDPLLTAHLAPSLDLLAPDESSLQSGVQ